MPRPTKIRKIDFFPSETYFKPQGKRQCTLEEIGLKLEELEAMRLKDVEGLSQEACAKEMEISRQTFQNILDEARRKVTLALVEGKAIRIGGGDYVAKKCTYQCPQCQNTYVVQKEEDRQQCPKCGSSHVMCHKKQGTCQKWCHIEMDENSSKY